MKAVRYIPLYALVVRASDERRGVVVRNSKRPRTLRGSTPDGMVVVLWDDALEMSPVSIEDLRVAK